jgi:hypothetical protein
MGLLTTTLRVTMFSFRLIFRRYACVTRLLSWAYLEINVAFTIVIRYEEPCKWCACSYTIHECKIWFSPAFSLVHHSWSWVLVSFKFIFWIYNARDHFVLCPSFPLRCTDATEISAMDQHFELLHFPVGMAEDTGRVVAGVLGSSFESKIENTERQFNEC